MANLGATLYPQPNKEARADILSPGFCDKCGSRLVAGCCGICIRHKILNDLGGVDEIKWPYHFVAPGIWKRIE